MTKVHCQVEVKPNFEHKGDRAIDCMAWFSDGNSEMRNAFKESLTKLDLLHFLVSFQEIIIPEGTDVIKLVSHTCTTYGPYC